MQNQGFEVGPTIGRTETAFGDTRGVQSGVSVVHSEAITPNETMFPIRLTWQEEGLEISIKKDMNEQQIKQFIEHNSETLVRIINHCPELKEILVNNLIAMAAASTFEKSGTTETTGCGVADKIVAEAKKITEGIPDIINKARFMVNNFFDSLDSLSNQMKVSRAKKGPGV